MPVPEKTLQVKKSTPTGWERNFRGGEAGLKLHEKDVTLRGLRGQKGSPKRCSGEGGMRVVLTG